MITDPIQQKLGTVFSIITIISVSMWAILQIMRYYAITFRGIDIPIPENIDSIVGGLVLGYLGFRKNQNAGIINELTTGDTEQVKG